MKKTILLLMTVVVAVSCGSKSPEEIQKEINEKYIAQANTYMNAKIAEDEAKGIPSIQSFTIKGIDTIAPISSYAIEVYSFGGLQKEYEIQLDFAKGLLDIDEQFGTAPDRTTKNAIHEASVLGDSLEVLMERASKLSKTDTVGYDVTFIIDFKLADATTMKDKRYHMNYDAEHDLKKEWNP